MKAVADTVGVARSNLHDKVRRAAKPRVPIANLKMRTCCH